MASRDNLPHCFGSNKKRVVTTLGVTVGEWGVVTGIQFLTGFLILATRRRVAKPRREGGEGGEGCKAVLGYPVPIPPSLQPLHKKPSNAVAP